jgi:hypothetical protein
MAKDRSRPDHPPVFGRERKGNTEMRGRDRINVVVLRILGILLLVGQAEFEIVLGVWLLSGLSQKAA